MAKSTRNVEPPNGDLRLTAGTTDAWKSWMGSSDFANAIDLHY